jgi:DNA processing protein
MSVKKVLYNASGYPAVLRNLVDAPKQLFISGDLEELLARPRVAIVGSRKISAYGRSVTAELAGKLAEQGIVIVSGLALGVDACAHRAALDAGGLTMAVLPGPVEKIYPSSHTSLAQQIVAKGGALVSEYPAGSDVFKFNFIARNRIIAGLADTMLITEAAEKSGSLHTARFALEQGKDVLAVPGNIDSPTSVGTNNLLKSGAAPITNVEDILHILGLEPQIKTAQAPKGANEHEQTLLDLIATGIQDGAELQALSNQDAALFGQTLTMLELTGKIRPLGNNQWSLS